MAKTPLSKYCSITTDEEKKGACIQKLPFNGGAKRQFFLSDMEMIDFAIAKPVVDQRIRKFSLFTHRYRQGKISKEEMMRRARKHFEMIQIGELNGCQPSICLKRKSSDSDDEEGFEGLVNTEFFSNVNVQLSKINFFGTEPYALTKSSITISDVEFEKLLEVIQKYLGKKGKVYEPAEIDIDTLSDSEQDLQNDQEEEIVAPAVVKRRKGRKGKGCKRAKGKGPNKGGSDDDEADDEEEDAKAAGKYKPFGGRGGSPKLVI